jgi:hypothetical protein
LGILGAADGTRTGKPKRDDKENPDTVETPEGAGRRENAPNRIVETQSVTLVTEPVSTTPLQRAALMRAIESAREAGRHLDAKALGELFALLGG